VDGGVLVAASVQVGGPLLDVAAVDVAQSGLAVAGTEVLGDQVVIVLDGEFIDVECRPPSV
jgi:hypothetical protein